MGELIRYLTDQEVDMQYSNPSISKAQRWADLVAEEWSREREAMVPPLILLVEDDLDAREVLSERLVHDGYHVAAVADGLEALHFLESGLELGLEAYRPDLMISDVRMPGISGIELVARVKDLIPDLPTILMTGFGSRRLKESALEAGCDEVLFKPLSYDVLETQARRLLLSSALTPEAVSRGKTRAEDEAMELPQPPWSPYN